jgi:HAD superfamily hydrolase (TIGR01509 family)
MVPSGFIFDLDGTLVDSYTPITRSLNHVLGLYGLEAIPKRRVKRMVGHGLEELIGRTIGGRNIPQGVKLFREKYREIYLAETRLLPGVRRTLERLHRRGCLMAVATNKLGSFSEKIVEHLGINRYFEVVLGPEKVPYPKPHPAMVETILLALGLKKEGVVFVGDMVVDIETARRAGLKVCVVPGGSSTRRELLAAAPDYFARSFSEIEKIFS